MKTRRNGLWRLLALVLVGGLLLAGRALAEPTATSIDWWVVAGGGGPASNGSIIVDGTAGQAVAGPSSAGDLAVGAGYWYGAPTGPLPLWPLAIHRSGAADVRLDWNHVADGAVYEVWRGTTPAFVAPMAGTKLADVTPAGGTPVGASLIYTDTGAFADTSHDYYYFVKSMTGGVPGLSNRVGKFVITLTPDWNLVAWPVLPPDTSLDGTLDAQLYGTADPLTADQVFAWDGDTQAFTTAWFCGGADCLSIWGPDFYNHWLADDLSYSTLTLPADSGFWLVNLSGGDETLSVVGSVADSTRAVTIGTGWRMLGRTFPTAQALDEAGLAGHGAADPLLADTVLYWDAALQSYQSAWLAGGPDCEPLWGELCGHWLADDLTPTTIVLEPGHGFWYLNTGAAFTWDDTP